MSRSFSSTLGILGGGQLGRMLLQKACDFSLRTRVLDPDSAAPCRFLTDEFVQGNFNDEETVYKFGKACDLITIEIEHVNIRALERLEAEGKLVYPQTKVIRTVQDKGTQKIFYRTNKIPTADFHLISGAAELKSYGDFYPCMMKLRRGGYDGRGVMKLKNQADAADAFGAPSIIEKLVNFEKELAVLVARNSAGEVKAYPPVEMEFNPEANLVEFLSSPADISRKIAEKATALAVDVINALEMTGLLAVEMFLTGNGELLVNEIAPRPHNSGHHTIEGNMTSQYEQHLRAIMNLPLGATDIIRPAVMINLLGAKNEDGPVRYDGLDEAMTIEGAYVHLYGKHFTRPFRKMGHVTITSTSIEDARTKAEKIRDMIIVRSAK